MPVIVKDSNSTIISRYSTLGDLRSELSRRLGFRVQGVNNGVNCVTAQGNITGSPPILKTDGSDTNIDLLLRAKGTGDKVLLANSTAAYILEQDGKLIGKIFRPLIDYMLFFDPKHCEESYKSEFEKKQLPNEYRRE